MNAKEALEKIYNGEYQTAEGFGELVHIVSEGIDENAEADAKELAAIKERARTLTGRQIDGKTLNEIIDFIIKGEGK